MSLTYYTFVVLRLSFGSVFGRPECRLVELHPGYSKIYCQASSLPLPSPPLALPRPRAAYEAATSVLAK